MTLRVTHVINGLTVGGAEMLLVQTIERLAHAPIENHVVLLTTPGPLSARLEATGVNVDSVGLRVPPSPAGLARLRRMIDASEPDVVQTWLLNANVLGGLAARSSRAPVAWGVHITKVDVETYGRLAWLTQRAEGAISARIPEAIVACSESAARSMLSLGYPAAKLVTVPNGIDTETFRPDPADRDAVRAELGIGADELVVGHVARFHPMKDQANLLAAAARVLERVPRARFVLCGRELDNSNAALTALARPHGERVALLGERDDVRRLLRSFDVFALSSATGEALPLVVGESMASGVPVVATDCGDSPFVVGDTGRIVAVRDPAALADALVEVLELPVSELGALGEAARRRIVDDYSLESMVAGYRDVWERLAASRSS